MSDDRTRGVTFEGIDAEDLDYPISTEELREEHGDAPLDVQGAETTLGEVLEGYEDELGSVDELEEAVLTMLPEDAVGREDYSDRGSEAAGGQDHDEESL